MVKIKEPLHTVLVKYCDVECYDPQFIRESIISGRGFPYDAELVKNQLREVIDNQSMSPDEYEQLTKEDFDSQEDLFAWLEELLAEFP
ncbi:hypothetical protein [Vibrio quintilis]|uniref:CdiI immunity protein domain-containing protein n=1 Tax=Vibrio quintilis TaxID=1117707 RepID=A0A1M7Z2P8_9VIBR|nr:hypothetical protein [Vibrio quintilis]SHO59173.1 hypothetical protein VQ7734_04953 [Vibrio quintilis]